MHDRSIQYAVPFHKSNDYFFAVVCAHEAPLSDFSQRFLPSSTRALFIHCDKGTPFSPCSCSLLFFFSVFLCVHSKFSKRLSNTDVFHPSYRVVYSPTRVGVTTQEGDTTLHRGTQHNRPTAGCPQTTSSGADLSESRSSSRRAGILCPSRAPSRERAFVHAPNRPATC